MRKGHTRGLRLLPLAIAVAFGASLSACGDEGGTETIRLSADPETFPTMRTTDVSTLISDSGYTRYHITTDLWLVFEEAAEPRWLFPTGIDIVKFDNFMHPNGAFVADTATYFSKKKLWRFDRNVRMRNIDGDRFLTQQLFWDQNAQKVYSDSFIHIERQDRTIEGYGFESNQDMTVYTVRRPSGIFPTSAFVGGARGDSAATAPVSPLAASGADSVKMSTSGRAAPQRASQSATDAIRSAEQTQQLKAHEPQRQW